MKGETKASVGSRAHRTALMLAVAALLCLPSAFGQHPGAPRPASGARFAGFRGQANRNQPRPQQQARPRSGANPGQQNSQYRSLAPQAGGYRPDSRNPSPAVRPATPGTAYQGQGYGQSYARPNYPGAAGTYAPPGHLGAWLNAHRGVPAQDQERMLRNDPSFNRLPPAQQQRLVQQLNRVDQMPEAQRERTLARAENLERLSPQQRAQVQDSARQWRTLPTDRQAIMKDAFRDLRNVPPDQRQTVLNSARYQNAFSPEERVILGNMLSVEPYQAPR